MAALHVVCQSVGACPCRVPTPPHTVVHLHLPHVRQRLSPHFLLCFVHVLHTLGLSLGRSFTLGRQPRFQLLNESSIRLIPPALARGTVMTSMFPAAIVETNFLPPSEANRTTQS